MKIAIHDFDESFSTRWVIYCEGYGVSYKLVDCYASNIMEQLEGCDALMWHWHHGDPKAVLFARQLTYSLEAAGKKVFPDSKTCWHFDDKVGQKYLLEAIGVPMVPSYVFYDKASAINWVERTSFPKVFKLRGGAGSSNVMLARTKSDAKRLVSKAFGRGFSQFNRWGRLKDRWINLKSVRGGLLDVLKGCFRVILTPAYAKAMQREKGYAYFQEFIPNNDADVRVIVVGSKAFAIKRMCRDGDFRASGSGEISYERSDIDVRCVQTSFEVSKKINAQCLAYDYVFDENGNPLIIEISYGFAVEAYDPCPGYWDDSLTWHEGSFNPQTWMVELMLEITNKIL